MFLSALNLIKKQIKVFLDFLKKQETVLFYGSIVSYILAFFSFLVCSIAPNWTLIKLFNILLLIFVLLGAICSGLFNFIHFFYRSNKK